MGFAPFVWGSIIRTAARENRLQNAVMGIGPLSPVYNQSGSTEIKMQSEPDTKTGDRKIKFSVYPDERLMRRIDDTYRDYVNSFQCVDLSRGKALSKSEFILCCLKLPDVGEIQ